MKKGVDRRRRIAEEIKRTLAQILLQELEDKRFQFVTITGVEVSRDLAYAKVYVSLLQDDEDVIKETVKALNGAAKFMRHQLVKVVDLRIAPELKFVYDESIARGFHISSLLHEASKKEKK